jgi:hypothetical protein
MRASRILLLALTVLVFAACSGPEEPSLTAPADSAAPSTTGENEPDTLAFEDPVDELEPITLRISLPRMSFVAPHVVDETDSVQVLATDLLTDGLTVTRTRARLDRVLPTAGRFQRTGSRGRSFWVSAPSAPARRLWPTMWSPA